MNENLVYFLLGIGVSTLFHLFPRYRAKYEISFIELLNYDINDSERTITDNIPSAQKIMVGTESELFTFKMKNSGNQDISSEMLREDIKVVFPNYVNLVHAQPVEQSEASGIVLVKEPNTIKISWDLLKPKEYLIVNTIIHIEEGEDLDVQGRNGFLNEIVIRSRITNLKIVNKFSFLNAEPIETKKSDLIRNAWANLFVGIMLFTSTNLGSNLTHFIVEGEYRKTYYELDTTEIILNWASWAISIINIIVSYSYFLEAKKYEL